MGPVYKLSSLINCKIGVVTVEKGVGIKEGENFPALTVVDISSH